MIDPDHPIRRAPLALLDQILTDFARHAPAVLDEARAIVADRRGIAPMLALAGGAYSGPPRPGRRIAWRRPEKAATPRRALPQTADERQRRLMSRRSLANACHLPQSLRAFFSTSGLAVMAVIAMAADGARRAVEVSVAELARRSFTSPSTVRSSIDLAESLGILANDDRRRRADGRSFVNAIRIVSRDWIGWLRRRLGLGSKKFDPKGEKANKTREAPSERPLVQASTPAAPSRLRRLLPFSGPPRPSGAVQRKP